MTENTPNPRNVQSVILPGKVTSTRLPPPILVEGIRPPILETGHLLDQVRAAVFSVKRIAGIIPHPPPLKHITAVLDPVLLGNEHPWASSPVEDPHYVPVATPEVVNDKPHCSEDKDGCQGDREQGLDVAVRREPRLHVQASSGGEGGEEEMR